MIRARTYEVIIEVGGKPEIEGIYQDEREALQRAEYLLKLAKYTAVRVHSVNSRGDHKLIFEKFFSGSGAGSTVSSIDEAFLCLSAADAYTYGSRRTLVRLMRGYFDQQLIIPLELLHNYMSLRYLERDALLFNQALHRVAAIQARAAKVKPEERHNALTRLYREVIDRAKHAEALRPHYRCLVDRGLTALTTEVAAGLDASERDRAVTFALAHYLGDARDWTLKLSLACDLFEDDASPEAAARLDEVVAEIVDGNEPVKAMIGYAPDLITALEAMLAAVDGSWDDRLPGTPALQKLSDIFARRPLPLAREVLLGRIAGAIGGQAPLTKLDRAGTALAFKRLIPKLLEFGGFMGGVRMSEALTRRAKVALSGGADDLSFESAVSVLCAYLPNPGARIGYLLDLLSSELGRQRAAQLTQGIAELFGNIRGIHDFAPQSDASWTQDMVREDFRRRLYQAGIPHKLADGLLRRLAQLSDAPPSSPSPARLPPPSAPVASSPGRPVPPPVRRDVATLDAPGVGPGRLMLSYRGVQTVIGASQTPYVIGRGDACDLIVDCGTASRAHAVVQVVDADYVLLDQSKNGTTIRGEDQVVIALAKSSAVLTGKGAITIGVEEDGVDAATSQAVILFQRVPADGR